MCLEIREEMWDIHKNLGAISLLIDFKSTELSEITRTVSVKREGVQRLSFGVISK